MMSRGMRLKCEWCLLKTRLGLKAAISNFAPELQNTIKSFRDCLLNMQLPNTCKHFILFYNSK